MPLNVPITEDMVRGLAPDDATWPRAADLAGSDRLVNPGVSADGTWLLADAKGAAKDPYHVSAHFAGPHQPRPGGPPHTPPGPCGPPARPARPPPSPRSPFCPSPPAPRPPAGPGWWTAGPGCWDPRSR